MTALALLAQVPPVAVTDSPPPIVTVPYMPAAPTVIVPHSPSPPAPPRAAIIRGPEPRAPLQQLISANDYPASALAAGAEGWVDFTLEVGPNGRVTGCMITGSSGSSALDSTTCAVMSRRARFTPAFNSHGMPAAARFSDEVRWSRSGEGE